MRSVAWLCIFAGVLFAVVTFFSAIGGGTLNLYVGAVGTERQESPGAASR